MWASIPVKPSYEYLRAPEIGLAQIRARAGGTGQAFNLDEVTVSRCTVQLASGEIGVGYVAGRNLHHAELAAVLDASLYHIGLQHAACWWHKRGCALRERRPCTYKTIVGGKV